jgi:hypothetical protein
MKEKPEDALLETSYAYDPTSDTVDFSSALNDIEASLELRRLGTQDACIAFVRELQAYPEDY